MKKLLKVLVPVFTLLVYLANILASAGFFNTTTTREVSDKYATLFTPIGLTFSIWGIIYILLAIFTYSYVKNFTSKERLFQKVGIAYIINAVANIFWLIAWSYEELLLSLIIMIIILMTLIYMTNIVNKGIVNKREKYTIRVPLNVYFAWICVATVANIAIYLVSIDWGAFGISSASWTSLMIIVVTFLTIVANIKGNGSAFSAVIIWAFLGILMQHIESGIYDGKYSIIIYTLMVSLTFIILFSMYRFLRARPLKRRK